MVIAAIGDCVEICFRRPTISRVRRVAARSVKERLSSEPRKSPWRFGRVKIPPRGCSGAPTEDGTVRERDPRLCKPENSGAHTQNRWITEPIASINMRERLPLPHGHASVSMPKQPRGSSLVHWNATVRLSYLDIVVTMITIYRLEEY